MIEPLAPGYESQLQITITPDEERRTQRRRLDTPSTEYINALQVTGCLYIVIRHCVIQYVGSCSSDFRTRFNNGLQRIDDGYRWPGTTGSYTLMLWEVSGGKECSESAEAELAFLHRSILGDWPIELNQLSPKRFLVDQKASSFGKNMAFRAMKWLLENNRVACDRETDFDLLERLYGRTVGR